MILLKSKFLDRNLIIRDHHRSSKLSLRVKPDGDISLTIPRNYSIKKALKFIESKKEWITQTIEKINSLEKYQKEILLPGNQQNTKFHSIKILTHGSNESFMSIKNQETKIVLSDKINDYSKNEIQNFIEKAFIETFRIEAKQYLPKRVEELSKKHNLAYNNVSIKAAKTRWGSCSYKNNINLSLFLMKLPNHLIDYVILHELTHTIEKNHSNRFWDKLSSFEKKSKIYDKELKKYSTTIKIENNEI